MAIVNQFPGGGGGGAVTGFPPFIMNTNYVGKADTDLPSSYNTSLTNRIGFFYNNTSSLRGYQKYCIDFGSSSVNSSDYSTKATYWGRCLLKPLKQVKIYYDDVEKATLTPDKSYIFVPEYEESDMKYLRLKVKDSNNNDVVILAEKSVTLSTSSVSISLYPYVGII